MPIQDGLGCVERKSAETRQCRQDFRVVSVSLSHTDIISELCICRCIYSTSHLVIHFCDYTHNKG